MRKYTNFEKNLCVNLLVNVFLFAGNFALGLRKEANGTLVGVKASMFDYSGKWLVSFERYDELLKELADKWDRNHKRDKLAVKFPSSDPQSEQKQALFLRDLVDKKHCHIQKFIDHLIVEGNRMFAGTETADKWCLYGDGLIQYWTKGNMQYLEERGFGQRLWRAEGDTNKGTRYEGKVVGNSPEINVGTDNDGFRDLGKSIAFHVGLSTLFPHDDQKRFSLGTVPDIAKTMKR